MNYPAFETALKIHYNTVIEQKTQGAQATHGILPLRVIYTQHTESENPAYHAFPAYWIL